MKRSLVKNSFNNAAVYVKGKTYTKSSGYVVDLLDGYSVEIAFDGKFWESVNSISIYLYSSKFAQVMNELFNDSKGVYDKQSIAHSYLPRKLRNDKRGCLAWGMPGIEASGDSFKFFNGGFDILFADFTKQIEELSTVVDIFEFIYQSDVGLLVAAIEETWVLCFLCAERGLSQTETIEYIESSHHQPFSERSKSFNVLILEEFFKVYDEIEHDYA